MKILIADCVPIIRDQVHVAFDAFPRFEVETAEGFEAFEKMRRVAYGAVVIGVGSTSSTSTLLDRLAELGTDTPLLAVATEETISQRKSDKLRNNIFAFVKDPIEPVELYRTISRLEQRGATPAS